MIVRWTTLGLHVDGAWFCSNACVEADAARRLREVGLREIAPRAPAVRLGAVLLHQGCVSSRQLGEALDAQRTTGLRLGAQLRKLGHLNRDLVLRALSAQNGVSYLTTIDAVYVRSARGALSADEVRALGIVPFRETGDELWVACAAPVPHAAIGAVQTLLGRTVHPYLVADEDFERLLSAYVASVEGSRRTATARDIPDGASRIAALAAKAGDVTVKAAHLDPFTWVRVAANGRISTLLVPRHSHQLKENAEWLAATTRH